MKLTSKWKGLDTLAGREDPVEFEDLFYYKILREIIFEIRLVGATEE